MKNRKWIIPVSLTVCIIALITAAQANGWWRDQQAGRLPDPAEELKRLYVLYMKADTSIYVAGTIRLYDEANGNELKETLSFASFRQEGQVYMKLGHLQMLYTDTISLLLDTLDRRIVLSASNMAMQQSLYSPGMVFPFESLLNDTTAGRTELELAEKNHERVLTIHSELDPQIASASITYDAASGRISSTEMQWKKTGPAAATAGDGEKYWLTRIKYEHLSAAAIDIKQLLNKIIVVKNGNVGPSAAYAGYTVENNIY